jgi:hypothetical protein
METPSKPEKKSFAPGAWCAFWLGNFIVIGIIGSILGRGHPAVMQAFILVGALYFIVMIPLCIVGYVKLKKKRRETKKQVKYLKKVSVAERRAERKRAKLMGYQAQGTPSQSTIHAPVLEPSNPPTAATVVQPANPPAAAPVISRPVMMQSASTSAVLTPTKHLPDVYMPQSAKTVVVPEELKRIAIQIVDDIKPTSIKAKAPKKAGVHEEQAVTPLPFDATTESEVGVQKQEFICVVHKGPITGANFLCPKCGTFYCMACAMALKKNGEKCWTCGAELDVIV